MAGRASTRRNTAAETIFQPSTLESLRLSWRLFRDPRVSPRLKTLLPALCLIYLLSPIDLIPDFMIGIGQVDDVGIIGVTIFLLSMIPRFAPEEIVAEHRAAMASKGRPTSADPIDVDYRVQR